MVSCFCLIRKKVPLSNYAEKLPHTAVAIRRNYEYDGIGFLCCLWQPYWPDWRAVWPAIATAFICGISQGKVQKYSELFNQAATILGDNWTAEALLSYFNIGNNFEFNDLVDIYWRRVHLRNDCVIYSEAVGVKKNWRGYLMLEPALRFFTPFPLQQVTVLFVSSLVIC